MPISQQEEFKLLRPSFNVLLQEFPLGKLLAVEVGIDQGYNASLMLKCCDRLGLTLVDITEQELLKNNIGSNFNRVNLLIKKSVEAAKEFPDGYFDYIYIDADHEYDSVMADLIAWYPKIKINGIFAGHDWWYGGVKKAVLDFFKERPQRLYAVHNFFTGNMLDKEGGRMDWWIQRYEFRNNQVK